MRHQGIRARIGYPQGAGEGHKGCFPDFGHHRKAGVVSRQEGFLKETVGLVHVGNAGEPEFLRQAFLQLDAKLSQGAADLGRLVLVHLAPGLELLVAAAIDVERAEQPLGLNEFVQDAETALGAFFFDEKTEYVSLIASSMVTTRFHH